MATVAVFIALGGTGYAISKINGKSIKKHTIAANRLKADTLGGTEVDEARLGEVPAAGRAASAARADTAATADTAASATTAERADTAAKADTATVASIAQAAGTAGSLGGFTAEQLRTSSSTGIGGICANPVAATSCGSTTVNFAVTSDAFVVASGAWYGTDSGDNDEAGECFITRDPSTSPSSVRQEMGQTDDTHDDFERASAFTLHATIENIPAGSSTFRLRCDENDADFHVEHAVVSVVRLTP
jgi:hypothetical protein